MTCEAAGDARHLFHGIFYWKQGTHIYVVRRKHNQHIPHCSLLLLLLAQEIKPGLGLAMQLALANPTARNVLKAGGIVGSMFLLHALAMEVGRRDFVGVEKR